MTYRRIAALVAASVVLAACSDSTPTTAPDARRPLSLSGSRTLGGAWLRNAMLQSDNAHVTAYVALGTSISMGWMNDGVVGPTQAQSWTKLLADDAGVPFKVPSIEAPGCKPPLAAPLLFFRRVDGTPGTDSKVCAPNSPGVSLPTNNLAVENATAGEGLNGTPETAAFGRGPVTSRVLPSGMTQVSAMQSQHPLFVSVEFGGNELLPAQVGVVAPGVTIVPFDVFQANYSRIIEGVKETHARAILVSIRTDLRNFPTIRTAQEIAAQRAAFRAYNVVVSSDCDASPNYIFVRGKVLTAVFTGITMASIPGAGSYTLSCVDVPGTVDFVLTPADIEALNALGDRISAEIERQAEENRYAVFALGALYNQSKDGVPFVLESFLKSSTPYGPLISLDGVHPSPSGHRVLADAAANAINTTYMRRAQDGN